MVVSKNWELGPKLELKLEQEVGSRTGRRVCRTPVLPLNTKFGCSSARDPTASVVLGPRPARPFNRRKQGSLYTR